VSTLSGEAHNLGQGGAERQLFYIAKALIQQECFPDVFTFSEGGYWEAPLRELGVRVFSITERSKVARFKKFVNFIKRGNYQYIHSQQFCTNLYAVAASLLGNVKCIGSIRNNVISEIRDMGLMGWFSLILPMQIVANSKCGIENATQYFRNPKTIYFLPNVVDTDVFSPEALRNPTNLFKVVTVGTVWKPKRIDRVIEIAEILKQRAERNIIFEIIGDGDELNWMMALAKSKGLLDSMVFFKGRSGNVASDYRNADALLLTSDFEGTPNVVLEAMSSGLPVVASSVGDVSRIIKNGETGFFVEHQDLMKMANIIEMLSQNPVLCSSVGRKARSYILENHSQVMLAQKLTQLYSAA